MCGQMDGANQAQPYVTHESHCTIACNRLSTLMSQCMTKSLAPRFEKPGERLYIWIEECKPFAPQQRLAEMVAADRAGAIKQDE